MKEKILWTLAVIGMFLVFPWLCLGFGLYAEFVHKIVLGN